MLVILIPTPSINKIFPKKHFVYIFSFPTFERAVKANVSLLENVKEVAKRTRFLENLTYCFPHFTDAETDSGMLNSMT